MQNKCFTIERILEIHEYLINRYGGSQGVRDLGGLESAIYTPFQTFGDKLLYPTVEKRAARLCGGIIKNHPFIDGNKRTGTMAMLIYLRSEGIFLNASNKNLIELGEGVAQSMTFEDIENFIIEHKIQNSG